MLAFIGSIAVALIFAGGGVFTHDILMGLGLAALGAITLGTMFAYVESSQQVEKLVYPHDGITAERLANFMLGTEGIAASARMFVGDNAGFHPVDSVFVCVLDGGQAIVLERGYDDEGEQHVHNMDDVKGRD
jgi:hypothetical protein